MEDDYIKLSDLRKVKGIGAKTLERIKETLLNNEKEKYFSKYNSDLHLKPNDIYLGDCLELMNGIKDKSVDMILCDLPYGTTACKWDDVIPFYKLWKQYKRIIKDDGAIVLFGSEPFSSQLRMSNIDWYKYDWVWIKPQGVDPLNCNHRPLNNVEYIHIFCRGSLTYIPQFEKGTPYVITRDKQTRKCNVQNWEYITTTTKNSGFRYPKRTLFFNQEKGFHTAQKPIALLEYLIKTYTNENELILDNCIGSGSTAVACLNTSRRFIGIEKEEEYYKIAKERIDNIINTY